MAETDVSTYSFDDLEICDKLLRGVYAYGFEKPSAIQKKAIVPSDDESYQRQLCSRGLKVAERQKIRIAFFMILRSLENW